MDHPAREDGLDVLHRRRRGRRGLGGAGFRAAITDLDARKAGYESRAELVSELRSIPTAAVPYKGTAGGRRPTRGTARGSPAHCQPTLRISSAKIAAMGAMSKDGPWALRVLRLIEQRPGVLAARLASLSHGHGVLQAAGPAAEGARPHREPRGSAIASRHGAGFPGASGGEARVTDSHFKGWAKPGPLPPGAASGEEPGSGETLDAISGHFRIFQLKAATGSRPTTC